MAGAVAAPPNPERARTKSDEGVMSWLTGNAPGEPHDDKENEGHTFADTVDAIRTEKGYPHAIPSWDRGRPSMYGAAPAHVMRSHEEMSPRAEVCRYARNSPLQPRVHPLPPAEHGLGLAEVLAPRGLGPEVVLPLPEAREVRRPSAEVPADLMPSATAAK